MSRVVQFFELGRLTAGYRDELEQALRRVLDSGSYILGPELERFEAELAAWCGAGAAVGVASGTDAITLALQAVGVRSGQEVITAANTCVPTVVGIAGAGAVPVLADVDPATATLSPESVRRAITPRTAAIVPVHLYGQCADMAAIGEIARGHGLRVVEDAAQAHGAEFAGRRAGTLADAAAFSFYPTKNLGALGDAGAVVSNDPGVAEAARAARNYGYRERDHALSHGRNSRLDELQAAVLSVRLSRLEAENERRRELAETYLKALHGCEQLTLPVQAPGRRHAWHLFVVRAAARDSLQERLRARGVQTLIHYPRAIHQQPAYAELARPGELGTSERLCAEVLSLPLHPALSGAEQAAVIDAVRDAAALTGA